MVNENQLISSSLAVLFGSLYQAEGTLKPWPTFNAEVDCERLRKAMKGLGLYSFL